MHPVLQTCIYTYMHIIPYLREIGPILYRSDDLIAELLAYDWDKADYAYLGETRGITVRFSNFDYDKPKTTNSIVEKCVPIFNEIHTFFPNYKFLKCEIYNCPSSTEQGLHIDHRIFHEFSSRLHVPLYTNDNCFLQIGDEHHHLLEFHCYEFNNMVKHRSYNNGNTQRIHLVFDVLKQSYYDKFVEYGLTEHIFELSKESTYLNSFREAAGVADSPSNY
jgi:Aspartyl/Asparaginyl beta-hydroxylase